MGYVENMRKKIGNDLLIIVGAGVFVYKDGKVLLQKRSDNGCWAMHGGCVEAGESVEDAARRELFEETGLVANHLELLGIFSGEGMKHTYPNGDVAQIIGIDYICRDFSGTLKAQSDEVLALEWFDIDELPENIMLTDQGPLAAFLAHIKNANP